MAISISHVSDTKKEQFSCTALASVVQCQCSQVGSVCVGGGGRAERRGVTLPPKITAI